MTKFTPTHIPLWLAFGLLLAACGERKPSAPRNSADLTIRGASEVAVPGWEAMKFSDSSQAEIYVAPTAALTLDDIRTAAKTRDESGRMAISILFNSAGAEKMRKFTSERIGQKAAIVFEGKVMNAPMIQSEISSSAIITGGATGLSEEEVQRILAVINQR
jgi:preprotein translocase subunit SecD